MISFPPPPLGSRMLKKIASSNLPNQHRSTESADQPLSTSSTTLLTRLGGHVTSPAVLYRPKIPHPASPTTTRSPRLLRTTPHYPHPVREGVRCDDADPQLYLPSSLRSPGLLSGRLFTPPVHGVSLSPRL